MLSLVFQDEENGVLSSKLKEVEEDRVRLQRTTNMHQTQLEKHRALADDVNRTCDGLRNQVTALQKVRPRASPLGLGFIGSCDSVNILNE